MLLVAPISTRNQFHELLAARGLHGVGVEVGAHRGEFARVMASQWQCERYWCVDPWERCSPDYNESQERFLWGGPNRKHDRAACQRVATDFPVVKLLPATSAEAMTRFPPDSLDFVYLDGDHRREHVAADLLGWWPKLRPGGLMAGHDVVCPGPDGPDNWGKEVQPALIAFASYLNLYVHLVVEEGGLPWSFMIEKPKEK